MKNSNIDLRSIGEKLQVANSVLLFPHVHPDGDSIGSCTALCRILRTMGKEAWVLTEAELPFYIGDLDEEGFCTSDMDIITDPDVTMAVDCCEKNRLLERTEAFERGAEKIAIDHHRIDSCEFDFYYIESEAAATAEIIYELAKAMEWDIDPKSAEALYTGIVSDTGSFKHSNTTPATHRIAADLMEAGADVNKVTVRMFKSVDPGEIAVKVDVLGRMELFADDMAAMSSLSQKQLAALGAEMENAETVIDSLIDIRGVEVAAMLKEDKEGIRVSFRSKTFADVAALATSLGGGGHVRASGCTLRIPLEEAYEKVKRAVEKILEEGR